MIKFLIEQIPSIDRVLSSIVGQLLALTTFFAFPILKYISLKIFARKEGRPELWYLPRYAVFRLVIRNLPRKKTFSSIKSRVILRQVVPRAAGISVSTLMDTLLMEQEDFFLFPGYDQVLVSFQLHKNDQGDMELLVTDKVGLGKMRKTLRENDLIVCDYKATIENIFNFNVQIQKRTEILYKSLESMLTSVEANNQEKKFTVDRVRNVG
jgi:hypothetical protein